MWKLIDDRLINLCQMNALVLASVIYSVSVALFESKRRSSDRLLREMRWIAKKTDRLYMYAYQIF